MLKLIFIFFFASRKSWIKRNSKASEKINKLKDSDVNPVYKTDLIIFIGQNESSNVERRLKSEEIQKNEKLIEFAAQNRTLF